MMLRSRVVSFVASVILLHASVFGQQAVPGVAAPAKAHDHAALGPHHGALVEIGKEEYHAEIVLNEEKKQMFVYLLDKDVKGYVAIEAPFVAVNLLLNGKPVQIKLKAAPQTVDQKGLSSCFGAVSPELMDGLHHPKSDPKLALKIRNKSYSVKIAHNHDHAGHDHAAPAKKK
jgi:hypothetical protein